MLRSSGGTADALPGDYIVRAAIALTRLGVSPSWEVATDVLQRRDPDIAAATTSAVRAAAIGLPLWEHPPNWWLALDTGHGDAPLHSVQSALRIIALPEIREFRLPELGLEAHRDLLPGTYLRPFTLAAWLEILLVQHYGPRAIHKSIAVLAERRWARLAGAPPPEDPLPF